ncbi:MAG TPA: hypothetical protein VKH37_10985, partial [Ferruginibacter sp.]|nr:hypothetical protein [Ferruginibacter sp.]
KKSTAAASSLYNTFTQKHQSHFIESKSGLKHWREFYEDKSQDISSKSQEGVHDSSVVETQQQLHAANDQCAPGGQLMQLHNTFIMVQHDKGYLLLHQQNAHERVLYEKFSKAIDGKHIATQSSLFPSTMQLSVTDAVLLNELLPDLQHLGYLLEPFGNNTFVIQGTPADVEQGNEKVAIERMLEQYKHFSSDLKFSKREKLLRSLALQQSVKAGTPLADVAMKNLLDDLFECETPNITPNGKPTWLEFKKDELEKMFGR